MSDISRKITDLFSFGQNILYILHNPVSSFQVISIR